MSTSLCFCRSAPMSENASLGTDFLPAIAIFRENVTLARRILPAGERSVRFNASGRWDFRLFTRLLGNKRARLWAQQRNPEMVGSCRAARGRLDPCLGAELSWRSPRARFRKPSRFASPARAPRDTEWRLRLPARRRFRHVSARYGERVFLRYVSSL